MKKLIKLGRFAVFLPYLILPVSVAAAYRESLEVGLIYTFFMPLGIESPVILMYPVCFVISLICFVLCAWDAKRENDPKGRKQNWILLALVIAILLLNVLAAAHFIANFSLKI